MTANKSNRSSASTKTNERSYQASGKNQGGPSKAAQSKGGQHSHGGKSKK